MEVKNMFKKSMNKNHKNMT